MSDTPDREEALEPLLRETLRPTDLSGPGEACLDAETAAAWFDAGLSGDERTRLETHVADCARCQALVAAMARAEPESHPSTVRAPRLSLGWILPIAAAAAIVLAVLVRPGPDVREASAPQTAENELAKADAVRREQAADAAAAPAEPGRVDVARAAEPPAASQLAQAPPPAPGAPPPAAETVRQPSARTLQAQEGGRLDEAALAAMPGFEVTSPQPGVRWRVRGSQVERTGDDGATWLAATGVPAGLSIVAGSAPSATVCWLVGRSGLVLVTTDGTTWRRLPFTEPTVDLSAVEAVDARTATVSAADGRRFLTIDGGATWTVRLLQGILAAPF